MIECPTCRRHRDEDAAKISPCPGRMIPCGDISLMVDKCKEKFVIKETAKKERREINMKDTIKGKILGLASEGIAMEQIAMRVQRSKAYVSCTISRAKKKEALNERNMENN